MRSAEGSENIGLMHEKRQNPTVSIFKFPPATGRTSRRYLEAAQRIEPKTEKIGSKNSKKLAKFLQNTDE